MGLEQQIEVARDWVRATDDKARELAAESAVLRRGGHTTGADNYKEVADRYFKDKREWERRLDQLLKEKGRG